MFCYVSFCYWLYRVTYGNKLCNLVKLRLIDHELFADLDMLTIKHKSRYNLYFKQHVIYDWNRFIVRYITHISSIHTKKGERIRSPCLYHKLDA